jgi:tetratricopeptide (TPR) repeat protein
MNQRHRRAAARKSQTASGARAASPAALYEIGLGHMQAGRYLDAQTCCQQALALDSDHADTLHLLGLLSLHAKQHDQAVEWISRAIRRDPKPAYLTSLGTTLLNQGRREEALQVFDKAVQLKPDDADLWRDVGNVLIEAGCSNDAILTFQQALKLNPRHWDAAEKAALLLYSAQRFEESVACFTICRGLRPDDFSTVYMRALALSKLKRFDEALADNTRAHDLNPTSADACNNLGNNLRALGRNEEAISWYDRSLKLRPDFADTFTNRAVALEEICRFDEAIAAYHQALAIDPNHTLAAWNLVGLQLKTGNFKAGWAGREVRWKLPSLSPGYPKLTRPMWVGAEPIAGKTLLVISDEGVGDALQFVRYVPMLAALGARVILIAQDALHPLLAGVTGISQYLSKSTDLASLTFDYHCSIYSLPLVFGTEIDTIPTGIPYLPAPASDRIQTWEQRLGSHDRLRVGLVWSGNPTHKNDHHRSLPLRMLLPILDCGATFVSLQKDPRPDDKMTLSERPDIVDLTSHLTDFAETAALISCLDLVITVDTSVAHLSGALGRPTWILLPYPAEYRWLLDRDDSPWYPTVRLFRQTETRDYASVIERVRNQLLALISAD